MHKHGGIEQKLIGPDSRTHSSSPSRWRTLARSLHHVSTSSPLKISSVPTYSNQSPSKKTVSKCLVKLNQSDLSFTTGWFCGRKNPTGTSFFFFFLNNGGKFIWNTSTVPQRSPCFRRSDYSEEEEPGEDSWIKVLALGALFALTCTSHSLYPPRTPWVFHAAVLPFSLSWCATEAFRRIVLLFLSEDVFIDPHSYTEDLIITPTKTFNLTDMLLILETPWSNSYACVRACTRCW